MEQYNKTSLICCRVTAYSVFHRAIFGLIPMGRWERVSRVHCLNSSALNWTCTKWIYTSLVHVTSTDIWHKISYLEWEEGGFVAVLIV